LCMLEASLRETRVAAYAKLARVEAYCGNS
jgi:hypothetical protein